MSQTSEETPAQGGAPRKFKFPTAFTVLAAVLVLVWIASFFVPAGAYDIDPQTGGADPGHVPQASVLPTRDAAHAGPPAQARGCEGARDRRASGRTGAASRDAVRRHVVHVPLQAALDRDRRTASTASRATQGFVGAVGGGLPLRLGGDLPVRARGRRVHHRDDEDGGDPDRDRPARAALPAQRLGADRDPDGRLRARRHDLRDVGGDARLLRPARPAGARARLRPDGGGLDHLPRRRAPA